MKKMSHKRARSSYSTRKSFFSRCHSVGLFELYADMATLNGLVPLECREITGRFLIDGNDIMSRFEKSRFQSIGALKQYLCHKAPHTLQFGGIFTGCSKSEGSRLWDRTLCKALDITKRELVIDVDMDDYDRSSLLRCKCEDRQICSTCWTAIMEPGRAVLDYLIGTVMKLENYFFIFSGRRGFHIWIFDPQVFDWTEEERANFLNRIERSIKPGTPLAHEIYKLLEPSFIHFFSEKTLIWQEVETCLDIRKRQEVVFHALFPKLDRDVTIRSQHLLKIPLVPHHTTEFLTIPLPSPSLDVENPSFLPSRDAIHIKDVNCDQMIHYIEMIREKLVNRI